MQRLVSDVQPEEGQQSELACFTLNRRLMSSEQRGHRYQSPGASPHTVSTAS